MPPARLYISSRMMMVLPDHHEALVTSNDLRTTSGLPTMSTPWILHHLYSLDTHLDFLRCLYCLIRHDEEEQYLSNPQEPESAPRLVDSLDGVLSLQPFVQLLNGLCRPSVQFPPTTNFLESVYKNHEQSAAIKRPYRPHTCIYVLTSGISLRSATA